MSEPRDASHIREARADHPVEELKERPETDDYQGRDFHRRYEETQENEGMDIRAGKKQHVSPEDAGNGPARTDHRHGRRRIRQGVGIGGANTAEEVENDEADMAEPILDIVAEYPQVEHIAPEVEQTSVHEHGGKDSKGGMDRLPRFESEEIVGYRAVRVRDLHTLSRR